MNRFKRDELAEKNRSQSSFSLKFKYEELVREQRDLILPPHYKSIFTAFCNLDQILNFMKVSGRHNRVPVFEEIKQMIETTYKQKFEFKIFAQILYIVPHFFVYKWEKINLSNEDYSLIIDIPKDHQKRMEDQYDDSINFIKLQTDNFDGVIEPLTSNQLEERRKFFRSVLMQMVNEYHSKFMDRINFPKEFDPFKMRTWHHDFDIENIPAIPIFEILEKPNIHISSINDFLRETDIKNSLVKRAIEELNNKNNLESSENAGKLEIDDHISKSNEDFNLSKIVSTNFLQKIKAKEEAVNISKNILEYSTQNNRLKNRVKDFKNLVDKMHTLFLTQKKPSIPINEFIQKILNSSETFKHTFSADNLKNIILNLREIFPSWITIMEHSFNGTLIKLEKVTMVDIIKQVSDPTIIDKIENNIY